jgi:hypothetical protein
MKTTMRTTTIRLLLPFALLMALAGTTTSAADDSARDELERRARVINRAAEKEAVFKQALHHVSIETGVPKETIEAQHRRYSDIGLAGILLANVMAAETKKDPTDFLKLRKDGKNWVQIARANRVPLENLNRKLDNLDRAIGASAKKPAEKEK